MRLLTMLATCVASASSSYDVPNVEIVDQSLEELKLQPTTQKSRVLGSLYYFVRLGDSLIFESSPINREIQLLLGDILLDEYGSMISN